MIRLILTSDIADIWQAAAETRSFAEWISCREGFKVSTIGTFHALLAVRPWATVDVRSAPWRVISAAMSRMGY